MIKTIEFKYQPSRLVEALKPNVDFNRLPVLQMSFDFASHKLTACNDKFVKTWRVEDNWDFVFGILKTKIKARGGIEGLHEFVQEQAEHGAVLNNRVYGCFTRALAKFAIAKQ